MHIPNAKQLEKWYLSVLEKAQAEGAVSGFDDNTGRHTKLGNGKEQRDARKPDFLFRGSDDSPSTGLFPDEADLQDAKRQKTESPSGGAWIGGGSTSPPRDGAASNAAAAGPQASPGGGLGRSLRHMPVFKGDNQG